MFAGPLRIQNEIRKFLGVFDLFDYQINRKALRISKSMPGDDIIHPFDFFPLCIFKYLVIQCHCQAMIAFMIHPRIYFVGGNLGPIERSNSI